MDPVLIATIVSGIIVLICILALLKQRSSGESKPARPEAQAHGQEAQGPRRAVGARGNARARLRATARHQNESDVEEAAEPVDEIEFPDGKVGAKKRAKLEAKAERKAQREVEERDREEKKKRQVLEEQERLKDEEKAKIEKEKQLEEEQKAREEKERQEHEEYMQMIKSFSVEEEGYDDEEGTESEENLLQEFINYIKKMKVVVLEDLAANFKLKTQNVIDRIQELQAEGALTGVVDDRGKFIYISQEELAAVAKFVKQRGRVSIVELAESSNELINLNPNLSVAVNS